MGWIAQKYPDVIRNINALGHEIGSHTSMHQLIYEQNQQEFREDLKRSIGILEEISGKKVESFRAPGFSLTSEVLWAFEELYLQGIKYDSSIFPAQRAHGGISNFQTDKPHILRYSGCELKEFPINVKNILGKKVVFTGGGYFRLVPYFLLNQWTRSSEYIMTYFHPRDFDFGQPVIQDLPLIKRFKSYYGLQNSFGKFNKYVNDFEFIDLAEAVKKIEWESAPLVDLDI